MGTSTTAARHERQTRSIAVVSDGSALTVEGGDVVEILLRGYADALAGLAGFPAHAIAVDGDDEAELAARLLEIANQHRAILLTHCDPLRAQTIQHEAHATRAACVITDRDVLAIALTATTLTTLAQRGLAPQDSTVLVIGSRALPLLTVLLISAGARDIALWHVAGNTTGALDHATSGVDIVIDLLDTLPANQDRLPAVITQADADTALYAAAGILAAAVRIGPITARMDAYTAAATALAAQPRSEGHPDHTLARNVVGRVADAVVAVTSSPGDR